MSQLMFESHAPPIRFLQFNVENLFLYMDLYDKQDLSKINEDTWQKYSSSVTPNKSLHKTRQVARLILESKADIVMLNEVGGEESIKNFCHHFLGDEYIPLLKEGNSNRGIDVGYLLRKDLQVKPVLISHKNRPINFLYPREKQTPAGGKSHYFSRDVAELRLFAPGENSPRLVILLTHLKSKLDPEMKDVEGRLRRRAELETLVQIYNEVRTELNQKVPVIVAGDFNGIARRGDNEPEFEMLHEKTDLIEVLEVANVNPEERFSQVQIYTGAPLKKLQIDYIFVSPELKDQIVPEETGIRFFKNDLNQPIPVPKSLEERNRLPSDHYPLQLTLRKI
ncbi:MAG: endonuclease/exonuclease/phosphatase family protein [Bdellovibrionota bacterium]